MISKFYKEIKKMSDSEREHVKEKLDDYLDDYFKELKHKDKEQYKRIKCDLYKILYGEHMNKEKALKVVSKMENTDGTQGEHWTFEQVESIVKQHSVPLTTYNINDFYYVLNMLYSDFYKVLGGDTSLYVKLSRAWLEDEDVREGKAFRYYMYVVK